MRIISVEGLIGFKLQTVVNNTKRARDIDDIRRLLRNNLGTLGMEEVKSYFMLFDRKELLNELLAEG